jgi:hypothetical protein
MGRGKCRLTLAEKLAMVKEAYSTPGNVKATARKYMVDPSNIRNWKKLEQRNVNATKRAHFETTSRHNPEIFQHLLEFFENQRQAEQAVTVSMLAREVGREFPDFEIGKTALRKRIYRWMKSVRISNRRVTHVAQNTRWEAGVIENFVNKVNERISMGEFDPNSVINMDETNFNFDDTRPTTLERVGSRTVSVRGTKACRRASVILAVTLGGLKLPPFVIFKAKRGARVHREVTVRAFQNGYPSGIFITVQKSAWNDSVVMREWVERVYKPWICVHGFPQSLLLMDDFKPHWVDAVKDDLGAFSAQTICIPKGYTAKCQVLDVGVNKPFHDYTLDAVDEFLVQNYDTETGRIRKPKRQDIAKRILSAWERITPATIVNTWSHIGIRPFIEPYVALTVSETEQSSDSPSAVVATII